MPAELLDRQRFPTKEAIEHRLLDGVVPALFTYHPPAPDAYPSGLPSRWGVAAASRWLEFLARHLHQLKTQDLAWWRLVEAVPWPARVILSGLAFTAYYGAVSVPLVAASSGVVNGWWTGLISGLIFGLVGAPAAGLGFGIASECVSTPVPSKSVVRVGLRAPNPLAVTVSLLAFGAVGFFVDGLVGGLVLAAVGVLVVVVWDLLESPADVTEAVNPATVFGEDRQVVVVRSLVFFLGIVAAGAFVAEPSAALVAGVGVGFAGGFASGLGTKAWGRFTVARVWLAVTRCLPWSVMSFLDDAHRLGALRRIGMVYQFRHARLQSRLLGAAERQPTTR
jgi:hypothetical protein